MSVDEAVELYLGKGDVFRWRQAQKKTCSCMYKVSIEVLEKLLTTLLLAKGKMALDKRDEAVFFASCKDIVRTRESLKESWERYRRHLIPSDS